MILRNNNIYAAVLALAASAILSFIDNFVFAVSKEAGLWQFQTFRTMIAIPLFLAIVFFLEGFRKATATG